MPGSYTLSMFGMALLTPVFWYRSADLHDAHAVEEAAACIPIGRPDLEPSSSRSTGAEFTPPADTRLTPPADTTIAAEPVSVWWKVALAAVAAIEVATSIALSMKYLHERKKRSFHGGVCPESSTGGTEEGESRHLHEKMEKLVDENRALRNVVNAVWRGDNIDILDFEVQQVKSEHGSKVTSDESTLHDAQALTPSSISGSMGSSMGSFDKVEEFRQKHGQTRASGAQVWDLASEDSESTCDDENFGSSSVDALSSNATDACDSEDEDERLTRLMQWQMAAGMWKDEDEQLTRVMLAQW